MGKSVLISYNRSLTRCRLVMNGNSRVGFHEIF
nr:MAG TPA: hypothetical protein [Bacteriophage sp.]